MQLMLFMLVEVVASLPETFGAPVQAMDSNLETFYIDTYDTKQTFSYRINDGQTRTETVSWEDGKLVITGSYGYFGPDGQYYMVQYEADENGYRTVDAPLAATGFAATEGSLSRKALESLVG